MVAVGAATQASLLTQDDFIEDSNITVHGLNYDVVFIASGHQEDPTVLIPKMCPIPVRRSHHFSIKDKDNLTVKVYLRSGETLMELTEVGVPYFTKQNHCELTNFPPKISRMFKIFTDLIPQFSILNVNLISRLF